jgi:hypothetical protein
VFHKFIFTTPQDIVILMAMEKTAPSRNRDLRNRDLLEKKKRYRRDALFLEIDKALDRAEENTKEGFGHVIVNFKFQNGGIHETIIEQNNATKI